MKISCSPVPTKRSAPTFLQNCRLIVQVSAHLYPEYQKLPPVIQILPLHQNPTASPDYNMNLETFFVYHSSDPCAAFSIISPTIITPRPEENFPVMNCFRFSLLQKRNSCLFLLICQLSYLQKIRKYNIPISRNFRKSRKTPAVFFQQFGFSFTDPGDFRFHYEHQYYNKLCAGVSSMSCVDVLWTRLCTGPL